jgi:hypothetical protein
LRGQTLGASGRLVASERCPGVLVRLDDEWSETLVEDIEALFVYLPLDLEVDPAKRRCRLLSIPVPLGDILLQVSTAFNWEN